MSQKLAGKIALVTGGSSGLGFATARRFAAEGAHVFITGRRQAELDGAAEEIGPGVVPTPGYKTGLGLSDEQVKEFEAKAATDAPAGRAGTPDEVAKAVVFLASDDGSYVDGVELFVDGGASQV